MDCYPGTYAEALDTVFAELREVLLSKRQDYGPGNICGEGEHSA